MLTLYCIRSEQGYLRRREGALHWVDLAQASVFPDLEAARALCAQAQEAEPSSRIRRLRVTEEDLPCAS